ncbi:unnamed protein product, partial [Rotaria socialis]
VVAQVPIQPQPTDIPIDKPKLPNPNPNETQNVGGMPMNLKEMNQMLQQSPEQPQIIKAALETAQPDIARLIKTNPQTFLDLVKQATDNANSPLSADDAPNTGPNQNRSTITVELSLEEQQIINQMQEMGFDRNRAIEAFLLCERNVDYAINYLFNTQD